MRAGSLSAGENTFVAAGYFKKGGIEFREVRLLGGRINPKRNCRVSAFFGR
jgi:hypothetical protein